MYKDDLSVHALSHNATVWSSCGMGSTIVSFYHLLWWKLYQLQCPVQRSLNPGWSLPPQPLPRWLDDNAKVLGSLDHLGWNVLNENQEKWKNQYIISSHYSPSEPLMHLIESSWGNYFYQPLHRHPGWHHPGNSCVSCGQLTNTPPWLWVFPLSLDGLVLHPFLKCSHMNLASGSIF